MKKIFGYMLSVAAVMTAAACSQELEGPAADKELVPMTITVNGETTKTLVGEDGKTINWCEDDVIAIFDGVAKREFTVVTADGKNATFAGEVAPGATELYAVYPYDAAVECTGGLITATLSSEQKLDGGNVADGAILAVGRVAADASVQFKNAVGFLRVDVSYDDVTEIVVNGSDIAGTAFIAATGEVDKVAEVASSISLKPAGEKFAPGSYYVTLFPGVTPADKFSVTLVRADKGLTMTAANEITVPRNAGFFVADTKLSETYIIKDAATLQSFLASAADCLEDEIATVIKDIDLTGVTITPATTYAGTFNGNGHRLKNWTSSNTLFTALAATASVKGIVIDKSCKLSFPSDKQYFGFVVGNNAGTVSDVENYADITIPALPTYSSTPYYGSICGNNTALVTDCSNYGNLTYAGAVPTQNACYGAVVGQTTGAAAVAKNLFNLGDVTATINGVATKSIYWSGVVGWLGGNAKLLDSINYGNVTVKTHGNTNMMTACGIVNYAGGEVSGCINGGAITYFAETAEGLADGGVQRTGVAGIAAYMGWSGKVVNNNMNEGNITLRAGYPLKYGGSGSATKYSTNVAGLFGHMYNCGVEDSSNTGTVTSIIGDIDNASSYFGTDIRQSCGGIVASSWGAITDCTNSGEINVKWVSSMDDASRVANTNQFIAQVGGISGGDYHSGQNNTDITGCVNSGNINYDCDANASNNNVGGIAGWPHKENAAGKSIKNCENTGTITVMGLSKTRIGGISGGVIAEEGNINRGKIHLKGGQTSCTIGGVSGVCAGAHPIVNCENYGEIVAEVKTTTGIGGIVGNTYNQENLTIKGCVVNCDITVAEGTTKTAMVVGYVDSNKLSSGNPATTVNYIGTADEPNVVSGGNLTIGSTKVTMTEENYQEYAYPWGTGELINTNITYNVIWK